MYEVATGKEPFGGVPADGRPADRVPIPPSVLCPEIEPALERAILQCLEEDPSRRPESAKAIAALLQETIPSGCHGAYVNLTRTR